MGLRQPVGSENRCADVPEIREIPSQIGTAPVDRVALPSPLSCLKTVVLRQMFSPSKSEA